MDEIEITEIFDSVVEMTSDAEKLVPLLNRQVEAVTHGDDDPKFATFVIKSGWSKSKRFWGPELFENVAEQINDSNDPIVGYMGHIRPEDDPYMFPEIQLQWLGARVLGAGEQTSLAVKAYVLPETKGKDYLRRGLVKTVSWRGKVAQIPFEKGVAVKKFLIESIDLSRPRAAGMSARLVGALTSEMEEGGNSVKPEEIAALQENELRAHNPGLVTTIEQEVKKPLETKVGEMEEAAKNSGKTLEIIPEFRKLLDLGDDADDVTVLGAALSQIKGAGKKVRDSILASVLEKKFKDEGTRSLVASLVTAEMESNNVRMTGDKEKDEKVVSEQVNNFIDSREEVKRMVSEMETTPATPPSTSSSTRNGDRDLKPGYSNANLRVRSASR